jgi:LPS export ABC transporter protein LptC
MEHSRILLLVFMVVIATIAACSERGIEESTEVRETTPAQTIENFTMTETYQADAEWRLVAEHADIYDTQKTARVTDLEVRFYKDGKVTSVLTADWGIIDLSNNDMTAYDHVLVLASSGEKLETSKLRWDASDGRIRSDEAVRFIKGKSIINGIGFDSDPALTNFQTTKMVGTLSDEEVQEYNEEGEEIAP